MRRGGGVVRKLNMLNIQHLGRRAFTLVELLISITLLAVVTTALALTLQRQQRFFRAESGLVNMRGQLRQISEVLPAELRPLSSAGASPVADLYAMSDTSIDFRSAFGSAIACKLIGTTQVVLPPATLASGNTLTTLLRAPVAGDSVFILDDSTGIGAPGVWRAYQITTVSSATGSCPTSSGFTQAGDASQSTFTLTVSPNLTTTTVAGAPVRFFTRAHYALYVTASGQSYLGYRTCNALATPTCGSLQPVSGPYAAYSASSPGTGGLVFTFLDSLGAVTASPSNVARIKIDIRGQATRAVSTGYGSAGTMTDSLQLYVGMRNRH